MNSARDAHLKLLLFPVHEPGKPRGAILGGVRRLINDVRRH